MTENEIDRMEAQEIEFLVALRVMGKKWDLFTPHYAFDIAAAWQVVEKAHEITRATITIHLFGTRDRVKNMPKYMCKFYAGNISYDNPDLELRAYAETAPLAICRAALKAVKEKA